MSIVKGFVLLMAVICLGAGHVVGQVAQSPFSTFGIGEKYGTSLIHNQGMGGVGIGTPEVWYINNQNPALLVFNGLTTFEAGIVYESRNIKSASTSEKTSGGNMNYLVTSFPIKPGWWTTSVGLMPLTTVNYTLEYDDQINGSETTAHVTENGSGGLTQVYWSNGVRLTRDLSVGLKAAYVFSSILDEYSNYVNEPVGVPFRVKISERTYVRDFMFQAGVAYRVDSLFNSDYHFTAGAIYGLGGNLNATFTRTFARTDFLDQIIDSLTLESSRGALELPRSLGFGVSFGKGFNWNVGADFRYEDLSEFRGVRREDEEGLEAAWRAAVGGAITPDPDAVDSFLKRITYRMGLHYEKAPFLANNEQVKDFGINFGLSLPAGRSSLDLAFSVGKRGNQSQNILEESYYKVYFGITLNDQWFIKPKYD